MLKAEGAAGTYMSCKRDRATNWDSAGGRQSSSASAQTTGDPGADLRSLRWPETAERFNTDMLNMMALKAASPPSEQALGGRVRCHIRGRKLNQSE